MSFVKWFLVDSFGNRPDRELHLRPFVLKEKPFAPSKLKVEFETEDKVFKYEVCFETGGVISESLDGIDLVKTASAERRRFKNLFTRTLDEKTSRYEIKTNADFSLSEGTKELALKRRNCSLVSAALFSDHEQSLPIKSFWSKVSPRMKELGENSYPIEHFVFESSKFYYKKQDFRASMEDIMSKCDLGLTGVDIEIIHIPNADGKSGTDAQEFFMPYGRHRGVAGKEYRLPFPLESSGTQQVYVLLSVLLPVLESGGLALIDELESDLHPDLLPALLKLFSTEKSNPKGAQLVFTSHSTPLLSDLDKYQVVFVKKDNEGTSTAKRLDEFEGVRADDNIFSKYKSGAYGGLPKVGDLTNLPVTKKANKKPK